MKLGFAPVQGDHYYEELLEEVRDAETSGLESVFLQEHHEASERGDLGHDVIHEDYDPHDLIEDRFIVGDPDDRVEELRAYEDALGANRVVTRIYFEGMSHEDVMSQLELLCSEVAPKV